MVLFHPLRIATAKPAQALGNQVFCIAHLFWSCFVHLTPLFYLCFLCFFCSRLQQVSQNPIHLNLPCPNGSQFSLSHSFTPWESNEALSCRMIFYGIYPYFMLCYPTVPDNYIHVHLLPVISSQFVSQPCAKDLLSKSNKYDWGAVVAEPGSLNASIHGRSLQVCPRGQKDPVGSCNTSRCRQIHIPCSLCQNKCPWASSEHINT